MGFDDEVVSEVETLRNRGVVGGGDGGGIEEAAAVVEFDLGGRDGPLGADRLVAARRVPPWK